jgi:hypothetical protein
MTLQAPQLGTHLGPAVQIPAGEAMDDAPEWHISSRSSGGNCVEVQAQPDVVLIRDSKNRGGSVLSFDRAAFRAFLDGIRHGEFDRG